MTTYNFTLPDIGEGLREAEIVSWLVKIGDAVKENENIVEVQTDKAVVEISSPVTGRIARFGGEAGDIVKVGETLVVFDTAENRQEPERSDYTEIRYNVSQPEKKKGPSRVLAAPSVRKAAREAGIELSHVTASGKNGKITSEDLMQYIEMQKDSTKLNEKSAEKQNAPILDMPKTERITGVRKAIFHKMTESKNNAVQCTGMDEINVTELVKMRDTLIPYANRDSIKLTYLPFVIKAVAHALRRQPIFNSSVDEEKMEIIYHESIHMGIATATEDGLLVPVIRHVDQKTVWELANEIEELTAKARNKKLSPGELTGSTFTISSTGGQGGWFATPIINYPEVAILGVHKIKKQPIIVEDTIEIGHMMGVSLSFDHRIIDGEPANQFMTTVKEILESPALLIMEGK